MGIVKGISIAVITVPMLNSLRTLRFIKNIKVMKVTKKGAMSSIFSPIALNKH